MRLELANETLDDPPDKVEADGFVGFDFVTEPTILPKEIARDGGNCWVDVDRLIQTRPGLRFNTLLTRVVIGAGGVAPRGMGYYDTPGREAVLVVADQKLCEITGHGNNVTSNVLVPAYVPHATNDAYFAQLVDYMFLSDGTARLHHSRYSGGVWAHGSVTAFSDASAMPVWTLICSHGFRLLAYDPASDKIYASAVGAANAAANWGPTDNIRVGTGEGDPVKKMISGQNGFLIVIKERSAWFVDTSNATVANWTAKRITDLAGAVEGKTAVQAGQDVIYLSAFGVVSLGALATTDSINPAQTLSTPVQTFIDRLNKTWLSRAWAVMWRDLYLLALPLDAATQPNYILVYNTTTKRWGAPWTSTLPSLDVSGNITAFAGWVCGVVSNFGAAQETLICDNTGRSLRLDKDYEYDESASGTTQEIVSYATIKALTHELPENYKQPFWTQVEWFNSTAQGVQLNLVRDGLRAYPAKALIACEIIATGLGTSSLTTFPIHFPWEFQSNAGYTRNFTIRGMDRYRNASVQVVSQKRRLRLRAVRLASFIDEPALV